MTIEINQKVVGLTSEKDLNSILSMIKKTDKTVIDKAWQRLDSLVKPPKSLGELEEIAAKLVAVRGSEPLKKRCVIVFCADNGIVEEGVASAPQEVTAFMTLNFTEGLTGVCVLAKTYNTDMKIVDVGIKTDVAHSLVENKKVKYGTKNFTKEPAMTKDEALKAVFAGIESVYEAKQAGFDVIGIGEMGIGNTTTAAAVLSALTGAGAEETCGKGAGLSDDGFNIKKALIGNAIERYNLINSDVLNIIAHIGGLDIAAMTGAYIGAALFGVPVVADGFISTVSALCAVRLCENIKSYLFLSHFSFEKGYALASKEIGLNPCLNLNMRLGEGSGCPILFSLMDGALAVFNNMGTFAQGNISDEYVEKVQDDSSFQVNQPL